MKARITFVALFLCTVSLNAQISFPGKDNQHNTLGGEDGKNVAAIFTTASSSRQGAINQTVEFLSKYDLIENKDEAMTALKEYDDTQSEFTIPVAFRYGWHGTAPVMGAVAPLPPVILKADLLFQFYDEGKVRLIIKNFEDFAYVDYVYQSKSKMGKVKMEDILSEKELEDRRTFSLAPVMKDGLGKAITAFLAWGNVGLDNMGKFYEAWDNYLGNIDAQIAIADKLAKGGYFVFGNGETVLEAYDGLAKADDLRVAAAMLEKFRNEIAEGKLVFVSDLFWRRDVKVQFDYLFIAVNSFFGGRIEGIAEDGELTWELVGDKLLPVDGKLRKQLEKKKQDYFSYYGE